MMSQTLPVASQVLDRASDLLATVSGDTPIALPPGYEAPVRSSTGLVCYEVTLLNAPGIIDANLKPKARGADGFGSTGIHTTDSTL